MTAGAQGRFPRQGGAAASTVEALLFDLRQRGVAALQKTSAQRLDELNESQLREVVKRLIKLRSQYPRIDDALVLQLGDRLP